MTQPQPLRDGEEVIVFTADGRWALAVVDYIGSYSERHHHVVARGEKRVLRFFHSWDDRSRVVAVVPLERFNGDAVSLLEASAQREQRECKKS